jgi:hypothetical protein
MKRAMAAPEDLRARGRGDGGRESELIEPLAGKRVFV